MKRDVIMGLRGEVFSTRANSDKRTYFFNVKENRHGDLFLNIVESKKHGEEGFERHSVMVFEEDIEENSNSTNNEAQAFILALGGKENITDTDACITRLRMSVRDSSILKDNDFTALGAKGVIRPDKRSIQIILGTKAEKVAEEIKESLNI